MKNAAAISAQLVDMRNVGTHKSLKLTLHVPEEEALKAIAAFGWPTAAHPVAVAIAQLDLEKVKSESDEPDKTPPRQHQAVKPVDGAHASSDDIPEFLDRRKRVDPSKRLAQQAGICCADPAFRTFIAERASSNVKSEEIIAQIVRDLCGVETRAQIVPGSDAARIWKNLYSEFLLWRDHPYLTPSQPETHDHERARPALAENSGRADERELERVGRGRGMGHPA